MRRYLVTVLAVASLVAGCARTEPGDPSATASPRATAGPAETMPADFAATVDYGNGSVPPPYHYEWRLRVTESGAELGWRPGYEKDAPVWTETVPADQAGRERFYDRLRSAGGLDPAPSADEPGSSGGSSGSVEATAGGETYETGQLSTSGAGQDVLDEVKAAADELVPAEVWDRMRDKQDTWAEQFPE
jgi:hypothetical protein